MDILCGISCIGFIDKHINKQINNDTEKQGKENKTKKNAAGENRTFTVQQSHQESRG